jgi:hypothetical protein
VSTAFDVGMSQSSRLQPVSPNTTRPRDRSTSRAVGVELNGYGSPGGEGYKTTDTPPANTATPGYTKTN